MNDIKVSVIIPTYRPGDYLYECLGSLCRQTLGCDSFEVIIVLNGCNEPYSEEIKEYVADKMQGYRVRFMQTDRPGVSNARNMALDAACGEYVAFIDDDDWVSPGYLADLLAEAAKGADVVEANVADYDETDGTCHDDYLTRAFHRNAARERVRSLPSPPPTRSITAASVPVRHRGEWWRARSMCSTNCGSCAPTSGCIWAMWRITVCHSSPHALRRCRAT